MKSNNKMIRPNPMLISIIIFPFLLLLCACSSFRKQPAPGNIAERVQPYSGNPFYLAWGDTPVFPLGSAGYHAWTPISRPGTVDSHEQLYRLSRVISEIGSPHVVGFVRCLPYDPNNHLHDGEVVRVLQPWVRMEDGRYDLERFEPEWEERLKDYLDLALDLRFVVSLEVWDDWSVSRTVRGERSPGPTEAWNAHPFNPPNNINYGYDVLPELEPPIVTGGWAGQFDCNASFYNTIPSRSDIKEVLALQKNYVDYLLNIVSDYPNVIINISNESRANLEWSRFWAKYIRLRVPPSIMIGDMPSIWGEEGGGDCENIYNPRTLSTDPHYDYVDISQVSTIWRIAGYRAAMREAGTERPLVVSKIYTRGPEGGTIALWSRFFVGAASARFHRPRREHPESLIDFQHEAVGHLGRFIARVPFWQMDIRPEVVNVTPSGVSSHVLTDMDKHYVIQITGENEGGNLGLKLPPGNWVVTWIDPETGKDIVNYEITLSSTEMELDLPSELDHMVVHLERRSD